MYKPDFTNINARHWYVESVLDACGRTFYVLATDTKFCTGWYKHIDAKDVLWDVVEHSKRSAAIERISQLAIEWLTK